MINVNNLNKYYLKGKTNEIHVINDCNLSLPDTGLITILGESGSGKTTLLNVIGGLDKATGVIKYNDLEFKNYNMRKIDTYRRKNIGYIFQNYNILKELTVYENLSLALELIGIVDKDEVDKRVKIALEAVGLYKFRKKPAGKLSGGQQQRVAIARALIKKCSLLIADEPTGNLDSANSIEIMNILKKISETTLVLLVTHDKELAEFYSDKIIELVDGKITNIRDANNDVSIDVKNDNKVYLKDLNKKEEGNEIHSVVFYKNEIPNIDLTIVEKNGTYFIKSNVKLKLLEESNLELIDDNYHQTSVEEYKNKLNYSTDSFNDTYKNNTFKRLFILFKDEMSKFGHVRKRTGFMRFILFVIGIVIAFMTVSICKYTYRDYSGCVTDNNLYYVSNVSNDELNLVKSILDEEKTNGNVCYYSQGMSFDEEISFKSYKSTYKTKVLSDYLPVLNSSGVKDFKLLCGKMPETNREYIIGKKLADRLLKKFNLKEYDQLLTTLELNVNDDYEYFVGVSSYNTMSVYEYDDSYFEGGSTTYSFQSNNIDSVKDKLKEHSLKVKTVKSYERNKIDRENRKNNISVLGSIIGTFAIVVIYIYFTMRSKLIGDIYEVGVLRNIGASKGRIYSKYVIEILITTTFTTLLGYVITISLYGYIWDKIRSISSLIPQYSIFKSPYTYLMFIFIYVINLLIGLLPTYALLSKTSKEISSKYDI